MEYIITILIAWLVTSVVTYGAFLGYYQREFPLTAQTDYRHSTRHALFMSLAPFAGLLVAVLLGRFKHGLKYRR